MGSMVQLAEAGSFPEENGRLSVRASDYLL